MSIQAVRPLLYPTYLLLLLGICCCISSCEQAVAQPVDSGKVSKKHFSHYLEKGNEVYASKSGLEAFSKSLEYFDTASMIAHELKDSLLIGEAIFAQGRVYDAWNKEPDKTIAYFTKAAAIYGRYDSHYKTSLYLRHLVAHAYDKIQDSVNCVEVLMDLYAELETKEDSLRKKLLFIPEMALISTEVGNDQLAEAILNNLYRREWIENDPKSYNYLDHYMLTQARIAVNKKDSSLLSYLDSLALVYAGASNIIDSMYYCHQLHKLYDQLGRYDKAYDYLIMDTRLSLRLHTQQGINQLQNQLLQTELNTQRQRQAEEARKHRIRLLVIISLVALLTISGALSFMFFRSKNRYLRMAHDLRLTNKKLDQNIQQNILLNKELHHRVKNNLYMIFSLLQMQERKATNQETIEDLKVARLRIESIAAIHEQMMIRENDVDFTKLANQLLASITACFSTNYPISTHLDIDPIQLNSKLSFPISLILNEWISNSVKYARPISDTLEIHLTVKNKNPQLLIQYYDNGAPNLTKKVTKGLGSQIVELLCQQMEAVLSTKPDNPYQYQIILKHAELPNQIINS